MVDGCLRRRCLTTPLRGERGAWYVVRRECGSIAVNSQQSTVNSQQSTPRALRRRSHQQSTITRRDSKLFAWKSALIDSDLFVLRSGNPEVVNPVWSYLSDD